ncbi:Transcriptional regulator, TetR family protein [Minicystis rosea]|nr:Transcriptional regulator, TetR family protein [Minicystis rosea]
MKTAASRPPRRRLEPDTRREQILESAIQIFGERPYASVSTTEIAREVGVARALVNHYFGSKRELYLEVVRRMVQLPPVENAVPATGSIEERIDRSVQWYLDLVGKHGKTFVAVSGATGMGDDPEVQRILRAADNVAATKILRLVGLHDEIGSDRARRAPILAYGGMVRAVIREWALEGALTREQAHLILSRVLICLVREVVPELREEAPPRRREGARRKP